MIDVKELIQIHEKLMEVSVKGESVGSLADGLRALTLIINRELIEQESKTEAINGIHGTGGPEGDTQTTL